MNSPEPRELLTGYSSPFPFWSPFWSPDSRFVGVFFDGKLLKVDTAGGPVVTLCAAWGGGGSTWSRDGVILFGGIEPDQSLHRVSVSGGDPKIALKPNAALGELHVRWPVFLPDGSHFLYASTNTETAKSGVRIGALDSTETFPLMPGDAPTSYVAPGYLLFPRQGTLFAQLFDARKFRLLGEAAPLAVVETSNMGVPFSSSQNGVLAYLSVMDTAQLTWYDRFGARSPVPPPGRYRQTALSPNGKQAAVERLDIAAQVQTNEKGWGIWLLDLGSGILSPFTGSTGDGTNPVWSPDGRQVAFSSTRRGQLDIYRQEVGSSVAEAVWVDEERKVPEAWLKDGTLLFMTGRGNDYYQVSQDGKGQPKKLFHADFDTDEPMVSPDGRWITFNSLESGRWEVYVATFPGFTDKRQVSRDGGSQCRWRADSKELYFLAPDGKLMTVDVKPGRALEVGVPRLLFQTDVRVNPYWDQYGVTGDGTRFLVRDSLHEAPRYINVILNWPELLRR
jgi:hypothetical protein